MASFTVLGPSSAEADSQGGATAQVIPGASDPFFLNLEKKTKKQARAILERRIIFDSKKEISLTTQENAKYYLNLYASSLRDGFIFLIDLVNKSKHEHFREQSLRAIGNYCVTQSDCWKHFDVFTGIKSLKARNFLYRQIAEKIFSEENLDLAVTYPDQVGLVLSAMSEDTQSQLREKIRSSISFGQYDLARKGVKKAAGLGFEDSLTILYGCMILVLEASSEASSCLSKYDFLGYLLMRAYHQQLQGLPREQINQVLNRIKAEIGKTQSPDYIYRAVTVVHALVNESVKGVRFGVAEEKGFAGDYQRGFMLLALDKKFSFLDPNLKKRLLDNYLANFKGKLLPQILKGEVDVKILSKTLGDQALIVKTSEHIKTLSKDKNTEPALPSNSNSKQVK